MWWGIFFTFPCRTTALQRSIGFSLLNSQRKISSKIQAFPRTRIQVRQSRRMLRWRARFIQTVDKYKCNFWQYDDFQFLQIYFSIWTNMICNLKKYSDTSETKQTDASMERSLNSNKYNLYFWQIQIQILRQTWTQVRPNRRMPRWRALLIQTVDRYNLHFLQIWFSILTNTLVNLDKYDPSSQTVHYGEVVIGNRNLAWFGEKCHFPFLIQWVFLNFLKLKVRKIGKKNIFFQT